MSLSCLLFFLLPVAATKPGMQSKVEIKFKFCFENHQQLQEGGREEAYSKGRMGGREALF